MVRPRHVARPTTICAKKKLPFFSIFLCFNASNLHCGSYSFPPSKKGSQSTGCGSFVEVRSTMKFCCWHAEFPHTPPPPPQILIHGHRGCRCPFGFAARPVSCFPTTCMFVDSATPFFAENPPPIQTLWDALGTQPHRLWWGNHCLKQRRDMTKKKLLLWFRRTWGRCVCVCVCVCR